MANNACVVCGRVFNHQSKPMRNFTAEGIYWGLAHTRCSSSKLAVFGVSTDLEDARRIFWTFHLQGWSRPHTRPQTLAVMLFDDGCGNNLNDGQSALLDWWRNGPMQINDATEEEIVRLYRQLLREYTAWRAKLPPDLSDEPKVAVAS